MKAQVGIAYYLDLPRKNPASDLGEILWTMSSADYPPTAYQEL